MKICEYINFFKNEEFADVWVKLKEKGLFWNFLQNFLNSLSFWLFVACKIFACFGVFGNGSYLAVS